MISLTSPLTSLIVPAQRTYRIDVNRLFPHAAVAAIITSYRPVAVERVMTFGQDAYGATGNMGTAQAATGWLFAEGSTANGFQTFLLPEFFKAFKKPGTAQ